MFDLSTVDIFIRLTLAVALGLFLGVERSIAGKVAGMRTFGLVSLSSALFIITSMLVTDAYLGRVNFDPMRTLAAIISGIGFIGAGMILFRENVLRGLTTAAGLWVSAGVGAAVAFGFYAIATFVALLTLAVFTFAWQVEDWLKRKMERDTPTTVGKRELTTAEEIDE